MPAGVVLAGRDWPGAMGAGTGTSPHFGDPQSKVWGFCIGTEGKVE